MVRAVADIDTKRIDLTTLPGGYVVVRKLTYGELLHVRDVGGRISGGQGQAMQISMDNIAAQAYEFSKCIVEHNLEDAEGKPLNLGTAEGINRLLPDVGQEIEEALNDLNGVSEDSKRISGLQEASTESNQLS